MKAPDKIWLQVDKKGDALHNWLYTQRLATDLQFISAEKIKELILFCEKDGTRDIINELRALIEGK